MLILLSGLVSALIHTISSKVIANVCSESVHAFQL